MRTPNSVSKRYVSVILTFHNWLSEVKPDYNQTVFFAHWLIFIVNKRTDTWIFNLCEAVASDSGLFDS